jgi:hypothetical protein
VRKPISVSMTEDSEGHSYIVVVCDDGTMWANWTGKGWERLQDIPQDESPKTPARDR